MRLVRPRSVIVDPVITHGVQLTGANVGVPAGTILTTQATSGGSIPPGTYVDKLFPDPTPDGSYSIETGPVTFLRCRIQAGLLLNTANDVAASFCDIQGGLSVSTSHRATFTDCHLYDPGGDFIHVTGDEPAGSLCDDLLLRRVLLDGIVQENVIGDDVHLDGIQLRGARRAWLDMCAFRMGDQWNQNGDLAPINAAVYPENANGGTIDFRMSNCYLDGGTQVFYMQPFSGYYEITGNRWGPRFTGERVRNDGGLVPTLWSGNVVDETGTVINF